MTGSNDLFYQSRQPHAAKHISTWEGIQDAILEPCPWLPDHEKHSLLYFLWDIHGQRIVKFEALESRPDYAIVGHAWGQMAV